MFLAIDYGKKRIGLAIGRIIPKPLDIIKVKNLEDAIQQIAGICLENEVEKIILGMPIRSQGEEGTLAPEIKEFAAKLSEKTGLPIEFEEEQFSSSEAADYIKRNKIKDEKSKLDSIAAAIILEQYLRHNQ